jgi:tetratricopeptide (TPR) repeat protein
MDWKKFGSELIKRNVVRAIVAYLAVAWVLIQIASTILPAFGAPQIFMQGLIYLLAIGLVLWTGFSWVYDFTPAGIRKTESEEIDIEIRENNSRNLNRVILGALTTAVILLVIASFWAGSRWGGGEAEAERPSIAVIPLESEASGEDYSYFSSGMTEALITELSELGDLTVLSMATTRYLEAGIRPKIASLAVETDAMQYFVFGSLQKSLNKVDVDLSLSRGLTKEPFWTHHYQTDLAEIRKLWKEAALDIIEIIGEQNAEVDRSNWKDLRPIRPETYELYLKGKYYLNKSTVEDWQRGLVYLQEAIDRNPADPDAYAGMAEGYITWGHSLMPPTDVFPKAEAAAKRAIQLDSNNAAAWAALSQYHTYFGWDWELADYAFKRANKLNPNLAMNHYHRAWYHVLFGRMDEAIHAHKKAQEIDPFSAFHTAWLGGIYNMVGEYDKALNEAGKASQLFEDHALSKVIAGRAYIQQGEVARGIDTLRAASRLNGGWKQLVLAPALVKYGYREEAMEIAASMEAMESTPYFSLCLAQIYYADKDYDTALRWLGKARGHAFYPWAVRIFLTDPAFRSDPRYQEYLSELGLPPPSPLSYQGREIQLPEAKVY